MTMFISHNSADKATARALATLLVEQGQNVWFDEWEIRPGESIVGGIEEGLQTATAFVLLWSEAANSSNWVSAEVRAILRRRIDHHGLLIIPLMLDSSPLPTLIAEYRGFDLSGGATLDAVVEEITGRPRDVEVAQRLQRKLNELTARNPNAQNGFGHIVCPSCGGVDFKTETLVDPVRDDSYHTIQCTECGWGDWTQ